MEERTPKITKRIRKIIKPSIKTYSDSKVEPCIISVIKVESPYQLALDIIFTVGALYGFLTMTIQTTLFIKSLLSLLF